MYVDFGVSKARYETLGVEEYCIYFQRQTTAVVIDGSSPSSGDHMLTSNPQGELWIKSVAAGFCLSAALQRGHILDDTPQAAPCEKYLSFIEKKVTGHKGSFSILLILRLEVLIRLQLPLFGQEGESNIHRAEGESRV